MKHGVVPVTPGTKPKDVPKKPDGRPAVEPKNLTKTVDLTVQYVNSDGADFTGKLPENRNQTVTFTGTAYVDKVTGKLVNAKKQADGTWVVDDSKTDPQVIWTVKDSQEAKGSFTGVTSPSEEGYEITGVEVKVGGQDVKDASAYTDGKDVKAVDGIDHNHANIDITVTYAPDGGSGDNPGSNGGGDQGTTPTPEPVPETTPSPEPVPETTPTPEPVPETTPSPKPVPETTPTPEPVPEPTPSPEPFPETTPSPDDQPDTTLPSDKTRITKQEHIRNVEPLAEQEHNDQTVASPVKNEANEPQLPQTGEANTSVIGLLGMLVAGFAAILGFESSRSRKHKN